MKTFWRILAFAKPYQKHFPQYAIFALLAIIFGLVNLALLQPLFTVIFETKEAEELAELAKVQPFGFNENYFSSIFYQKLIRVKETYGPSSSLIFVSIIIGISALFSNLFTYLSNVIMGIVRADVIQKIRNKVFINTTGLHLDFFSGERKGDILSRMTNDIQAIENTIVSSIKVLFREPATIIVYLLFLFNKSVELTLFTLVFFPIMGFTISEIAKRLKKKAILSQESWEELLIQWMKFFLVCALLKLSMPILTSIRFSKKKQAHIEK